VSPLLNLVEFFISSGHLCASDLPQ